MRNPDNAFHLAIPCRNLDEAHDFYVVKLGCHLARRYEDRITLDFFGDQVVCHLSDRWDRDRRLYPRHFGITFKDRTDWDRLVRLIELRDIPWVLEPSRRFEGLAEEHWTLMIADPSNNILEFKWYLDPRMMY